MLVDINLLPKKERGRPTLLLAAVGILAAALLIWAVLFFLAKAEDREREEALAESAALAERQQELRTQLDQRQGQTEEQQLAATVEWASAYQYDTVPLLAELARLLPERGFLQSLTYESPNTATFVLQFDTSRAAAYYLTRLKASELLESAALAGIESEPHGDSESETNPRANGDILLPRYAATYVVQFKDDRIPLDSTAEEIEEANETTEAEEDLEPPETDEPDPAETEDPPLDAAEEEGVLQ